ncbi:MAG: CBS domain-containing protein [Deltaproteobacteria bacterium]
MPLVTKVRDLMIPLSDYAVVNVNDPLKDAALCLRRVYCEAQTGSCTEAGHRSALVLDDDDKLVGILDFKSILSVFIPEIAGGLTEKLKALGVTITFAEADAVDLDEANLSLRARVIKNAEVPVKQVMLKVRGTIHPDADVLQALKMIYQNKITVLPVVDGDTLIGIVRDSDLFLNVASILAD